MKQGISAEPKIIESRENQEIHNLSRPKTYKDFGLSEDEYDLLCRIVTSAYLKRIKEEAA